MNCSPSGPSVHRILQAINTRVGCCSLLQEIFPTRGLNPGLTLYCRQILYHLSHGKPQWKVSVIFLWQIINMCYFREWLSYSIFFWIFKLNTIFQLLTAVKLIVMLSSLLLFMSSNEHALLFWLKKKIFFNCVEFTQGLWNVLCGDLFGCETVFC